MTRSATPFLLDPKGDVTLAINDVLKRTFFAGCPAEHLESDVGSRQVANHAWERHNFTIEFVIPWLQRLGSLSEQTVVEIGCGTGAIAAALSHFVRDVHAYDFHEPSMRAAAGRLAVQGVENVTLYQLPVEAILPAVASRHATGVDMVMLFGVLEHQTVGERIATLKQGWEILRPGGLLVVLETPNRLTYGDGHTTQRPFFDQLPPELAIAEVRATLPRFTGLLDAARRESVEAERTAAIRFGQGVSFHEFAAAFGDDYRHFVALDGFEDEVMRWFAPCLDEDLLQIYVHENDLDIPYGFCRHLLTLALRKDETKRGQRGGAPPLAYLKSLGGADRLRCLASIHEECHSRETAAAAAAAAAAAQTRAVLAERDARSQAALARAMAEVEELHARLSAAEAGNAALASDLAVRQSLSWRATRAITAPLDWLRRRL